jgi:hypothetical protein
MNQLLVQRSHVRGLDGFVIAVYFQASMPDINCLADSNVQLFVSACVCAIKPIRKSAFPLAVMVFECYRAKVRIGRGRLYQFQYSIERLALSCLHSMFSFTSQYSTADPVYA